MLVRGGIPGELVRGRPEESSGVLRAEVEEVLEPSMDRLPALSHPGLDYGHIRYPRQLQLKHEVVVDALSRASPAAGLSAAVAHVTPAPEIWRYRSAVQPVVTASGLGYRRPGSSQAVTLPFDPVANAAVAGAWELVSGASAPKGVREVAIRGNDHGHSLLALIATSPQRTLLAYAHELVRSGISGVSYARFDSRGRFRGGSERLAGVKRITQNYGGLELSVAVASFAQPNPHAAGALYREAVEVAEGGGSALELFAGSGAISLHLAKVFRKVEAVEIDRSSVSRGREDARRLAIDNVSFQAADARRTDLPSHLDLVVVDPPRSGLAREVRERIDASSAGRLLYISCDPATWARDVGHFTTRGWKLQLARPYDFYPHTHHIELLSLLSR